MVRHYLECAIKNIDDLIGLTKQDIEDIKKAKNDNIYKRTVIKDEIIDLFNKNKTLLDNELLKLVQKEPNSDLSSILTKEEKNSLELLKDKLKELHQHNKEYARLVVAVNEFYSSLFDKIFPTELDNYKKVNPKSFSLLRVSA